MTNIAKREPMDDSSVTQFTEFKTADTKRTETILVIEDEQQILDLYRKVLEKFGYIPLGAKTGQEAIPGGNHKQMTST